ncbi:MAG TPA: phosphocholine cytidylyltransferase family protein [Myxococcota bacterium]|nr:phosphocholine cytidylyltransferase family protein [Myxococcota bacterium]
MRAIVLSAGQGKRLLPLTADVPKCLLAVEGERTVLDLQLETLARCGISQVSVVSGFGLAKVEQFLARHPVAGLDVEIVYNPFFALSDNLATCWVAREAMAGDFVLLNGDTLFEAAVLRRLLASRPAPVTVTIDQKDGYDDDDMKVSLDDEGRLLAIGKTLAPDRVHGESIGLLCFRGQGGRRFRAAIEQAMRSPEALRSWYLSVVNSLAQEGGVTTASVRGMWWREIDSCEDLDEVRQSLGSSELRSPAARCARG